LEQRPVLALWQGTLPHRGSREWASGSEAEVWLYAMYTRAGRTADLVPLQNKPWIRFRNANPTFKAVLNWQ